MINEFGLDLKVARRKSGLRQSDCAHLIGINQSRLSQFELGRMMPNAAECCALALIYDRSVESLFDSVLLQLCEDLPERVASLPDCGANWSTIRNRQQTINRLAEALSVLPAGHAA
ncbi:MAG: helix-turn-helix transcriptional regulator [Rhodobiaceae bacterium]|nr:helix-turn-helix transcriptional regulator [Rhodobiaceae bacterium]MCC0055012.1 helix-turn-helix transcriptional regulator [Rhodobiaceae bacterium]